MAHRSAAIKKVFYSTFFLVLVWIVLEKLRIFTPLWTTAFQYGDGPTLLPSSSPYKGQPVLAMDGYKATQEELDNFFYRFIQPSNILNTNSQKRPASEIIDTFAKYMACILLAKHWGLDRDEWVVSVYKLNELTIQANEFREFLLKITATPDKYLTKKLPETWIQMDFQLKVFASLEQTRSAWRSLYDGKSVWEDIKGINSKLDGEYSTTGLLFKHSGFFDESDDDYMFELKEGDISRPVVTGIGAALARVIKKDVMSGDEILTYIENVKREYVESKVAERLDEETRDVQTIVYEEPLGRCLLNEFSGKGKARTTIAVFDDGQPLDYLAFRLLMPIDYYSKLRNLPFESWPDLVKGDIENIGKLRALGKAAKNEISGISAKWDIQRYDFANQLLYHAAMTKLVDENKVEIDEAEIESYISKNINALRPDRIILVDYLYAPQKQLLDLLLEKAGGSIEKVFSAKSDLVKRAKITKNSEVWRDVFPLLSGREAGFVPEPVSGGMGYYLFKIIDAGSTEYSRDKLEQIVRNKLSREKTRKKVEQFIEKRVSAANIELY